MFPIKDPESYGGFPIVNLVLIVTNIYVFFRQLASPDPELFINTYALIPSNIDFARIETLLPFITSLFLHAGFLHILSNMWFLWVFGDNVEAKMGHIPYLAFYIFCGIAASLAQYLVIPGSILPMIGASGAIAGVLGAYLRYFPRHSINTLVPVLGFPIIISVPAGFMLVYWFIIQAFSGAASIVTSTAMFGGVAYFAHAGGFVSGLLFSPFFENKD